MLTSNARRSTSSCAVNHCWIEVIHPKIRLFLHSSFTFLMTSSISSVIELHLDFVGSKVLRMIFTLGKDVHVRSEVVKYTYLSFCQGHIWDGQKEIFGKENSGDAGNLEH